MSFSENLYKIRRKKKLSQKKLAELANVSQASVNYWEKGQRTPSMEAIEKLAKALEVPILELYGLKPETVEVKPVGIVTAITENLVQKELDELEDKMLFFFDDLNITGKDKAIEQVELLTKIPEYKNDPDQDQE